MSYAREDREAAQLLASRLEGNGWDVWWDRNISPGKSFHVVIQEALDSAKCVIVLWSKHALSSDWVLNEAAEGATRGILIPVLIEDVKPPLEFRRIHAADLRGWDGNTSNPDYEELTEAIAGIVQDAQNERSMSSMRSLYSQTSSTPRQRERDAGSQRRWQVELVNLAERTMTLRVDLTHETHTIIYRNQWSKEVVSVDGAVVGQGGHFFGNQQLFSFELSDGTDRLAASLFVKVSWWDIKPTTIQLSIAGRPIYTYG